MPEQWHPNLDVNFGIQDGKLTNETSISVMYYKDGYYLTWTMTGSGSGNSRMKKLEITILTPESETAPQQYISMKYDAATGQLTDFSSF